MVASSWLCLISLIMVESGNGWNGQRWYRCTAMLNGHGLSLSRVDLPCSQLCTAAPQQLHNSSGMPTVHKSIKSGASQTDPTEAFWTVKWLWLLPTRVLKRTRSTKLCLLGNPSIFIWICLVNNLEPPQNLTIQQIQVLWCTWGFWWWTGVSFWIILQWPEAHANSMYTLHHGWGMVGSADTWLIPGIFTQSSLHVEDGWEFLAMAMPVAYREQWSSWCAKIPVFSWYTEVLTPGGYLFLKKRLNSWFMIPGWRL